MHPLIATERRPAYPDTPAGSRVSCGKLLQSPKQLVRALKWKRFRSAPLQCLLTRCKLPVSDANRLTRLRKNASWPPAVREALYQLPAQLVSDWSFDAESGLWLYDHVRRSSYQTLIECGSGFTSVLIGLALRDRDKLPGGARCYSLEHDDSWLQQIREVLRRLGLDDYVQPVGAPLIRSWAQERELHTYDIRSVPHGRIDFLLVDGPPQHIGRADVIPRMRHRLCKDAVVVLDDAGRLTEQRCVDEWTENGWLRFHGFLPLGHGLALFSAPSPVFD